MRPLILLLLWLVCSAAFGADKLESVLRAAVSKRLPAGARVEVKISHVSVEPQGKLTLGDLTPDVPLGLVNFELESDVEGRVVRGQGNAVIRAYVPVAVAQTALSHGEPLNETNTRFEEREIGRITQSGYFLTPESLKGRMVKGFAAAGQAIGRMNSQASYVVNAGESVDLVQRKGPLVLKAKVKALQGGLYDQWVQVRNPSSGKLFLARVAGPGEVEIR